MSKIARNPVPVPDGVTVTLSGQDVKVKGPKGELALRVHDEITVGLQDNDAGKKVVKVDPRSKSKEARALWGTTWSLLRNMMKGVHEGYTQKLEIQGVGYRAAVQGQNLVLQLGYSHEINYPIPQGITMTVEKQTAITIAGIDKQRIGQIAAEIRGFRPPEPYKGKGIRREGEFVLRKEGKKK